MEQDNSNPYSSPESDVTAVPDPDEPELASLGARLGAALIDGIIGLIVTVPVFIMIYGVNIYTDPEVSASLGTGYYIFSLLFGVVAFVVLHGYLLHTRGQTIGKKLVGTQIVSVRNNRPTSLLNIVGMRILPLYVVVLIPMIGGLLAIINILLIFGASRRCGHDLIAGTRVIVYR